VYALGRWTHDQGAIVIAIDSGRHYCSLSLEDWCSGWRRKRPRGQTVVLGALGVEGLRLILER